MLGELPVDFGWRFVRHEPLLSRGATPMGCSPSPLDLVAELGIHASYRHPAVHADLIIAPPAEVRTDEPSIESVERVAHCVVGGIDAFLDQSDIDDRAIQ